MSLSVSYLISCCSGDVKGSDIYIGTVQYFKHLRYDSWTVFVAECEDVITLRLTERE